MTAKISLIDFRDLEGADIQIDYSKLDDSFWDSVRQMIVENSERPPILKDRGFDFHSLVYLIAVTQRDI